MRKKIISLSIGTPLFLFLGWFLYLKELPHPQHSSKTQIMRWLLRDDLAQQDDETIAALVDRLQVEIENGLGDDQAISLPKRYAKQLSDNTAFIKRKWFERRVAEFHDLDSAPQKKQFLSRQIELVEKWPQTDDQGTGESEFFEEVESWIESTGRPEARQQMYDATVAAILRWLEVSDLSNHSQGVRDALALRVEAYLSSGGSISQNPNSSSATESSRFRQNGTLLLKSWFLIQARAFKRLPTSKRTEFISTKLSDVKRWDLSSLFADSSNDQSSSHLMQIASMVDGWIASSQNPDDQQTMRTFKHEIEKKILLEILSNPFKMFQSKP